MIEAARLYTAAYLPQDQPTWVRQGLDEDAPLLVSGHQPEFFHPGVWFKNFLLARLRQRCRGVAINLVVDNDVCGARSVVVPSGKLQQPRRQMVEWDAPVPVDLAESNPLANRQASSGQSSGNESLALPDFTTASSAATASPVTAPSTELLPYEMATWHSLACQRHFPSAIHAAAESLLPGELLVDRVWENMEEALQRTRQVGAVIAQARHLFEIDNGVDNLELPISQVSVQPAFACFLADLLRQGKIFQQVYNQSLQEFRKENKVRSQSHPVPQLVETDGWLEMPFWIWSTDSPVRGPLYLKPAGSSVQLSDLDQIKASLNTEGLEQQLVELNRSGIAIRPRALMTTLFTRVFLADLFIHGIGGAKYDELTDRLIERYYGLTPPMFLTATSTHRLPLDIEPFDVERIREVHQRIRSLRFHPEIHLANAPGENIRRWIEQKRKLLASIPPHGQKESWHREMDAINEKLFEPLQEQVVELQRQLAELEARRRKTSILASREYSFLIHPPALVDRLHEISRQAADSLA